MSLLDIASVLAATVAPLFGFLLVFAVYYLVVIRD